jgi:hypothetical protein
MLALLAAHEAGRERLGELGEAFEGALEDLRARASGNFGRFGGLRT